MTNNDVKIIKTAEWKSWAIVRLPTQFVRTIRINPTDGSKWEWSGGGKQHTFVRKIA